MNTYHVHLRGTQFYPENYSNSVHAKYFIEDKGWLVFEDQLHNRVAVYNCEDVIYVKRVVEQR